MLLLRVKKFLCCVSARPGQQPDVGHSNPYRGAPAAEAGLPCCARTADTLGSRHHQNVSLALHICACVSGVGCETAECPLGGAHSPHTESPWYLLSNSGTTGVRLLDLRFTAPIKQPEGKKMGKIRDEVTLKQQRTLGLRVPLLCRL